VKNQSPEKKERKNERKKNSFSVDFTSETFCYSLQLLSTSQRRKYFDKNEDKTGQLNSLP